LSDNVLLKVQNLLLEIFILGQFMIKIEALITVIFSLAHPSFLETFLSQNFFSKAQNLCWVNFG